MSEPIHLTERERAVFGSMIEYVRERCRNNARDGNQASGNAVSRWMEDWIASQPTESASPPRVPGASAQLAREGVQSGPGQPTDIVERLERIRSMIGKMCREGRPPAMTVPADPTRDEDLFIADAADEAAAEIRRLREQVKTERRAGIEAAAQVAANIEVIAIANTPVHASRLILDAIRALADKPAPDAARKGG